MSESDKKTFNIGGMRDKVRASRETDVDVGHMYQNSFSWQAVSQATGALPQTTSVGDFNFSGKILRGGKYGGENLQKANFSGADLKECDFSQSNLEGADFSGADLSGADLSGANLNGAVFSGARLRGTNFTGAKMNGVLLVDADIQDAILLDVEMDQLAIEELQALVEYLAVYYPHKLNLARMNLTLLDFSKIDLSRVNLRGVDFTGVDFTGVNVYELDLSECIITPEQIAQALGRMPTPRELRQILAPKKQKKRFKGIDFAKFFDGRGSISVLDLSAHPGITIKDLLKAGKQIYDAVARKPDPTDEEILSKFHHEQDERQDAVAKEHNNEVRKIIEERKQALLNAKTAGLEEKTDQRDSLQYEELKQERKRELKLMREKYLEQQKAVKQKNQEDYIAMNLARGQRERGG